MKNIQISNKILVWILIIFAGVSFVWMAKAILIGYYPDFNTQYLVPKSVFSGQNPYRGTPDLFTPQVYPPTVSLLYVPLNLLDIKSAGYLFTFLSIVSLLVSLFLLSKIFEIKFFSPTNLILMILVFNFFPLKFTLGMGQINNFILLLLVISLLYLKKGREFLSGIFLGLSLVIKIFPILLPLYLFIHISKVPKKIHKKFFTYGNKVSVNIQGESFSVKTDQINENLKILFGILTTAFISLIIVLIFFPFDVITYFIFKTLPGLISSWKLDYYNQALSGFVGRSFGVGEMSNYIRILLSFLVSTISYLVITINTKTDFNSVAMKFGALILASLIINNFSWQHHFVWAIIPFYATFAFIKKEELGKIYYIFLFLSYCLIAINFKEPNILPTILRSHVFFGAVLLLFLQLKLLYSKKV